MAYKCIEQNLHNFDLFLALLYNPATMHNTGLEYYPLLVALYVC